MNRLLLLLLLCVFTGCGTGNYDQNLNTQADAARLKAPFAVLYKDGTPIEGTNRTIRLPHQFNVVYQEGSRHPIDNGPIDARRLQPPFLSLPGLKMCYEATLVEGTTYPYYCYIAAAAVKPEDKLNFTAELLDKLKETFPNAAWESVAAKTPTGETIAWKKIAVKGDQVFMMNNPPEPKMLPGTFELWLHEGEAGDILIGWRMPDALASKLTLSSLAEISAGTLALKPDANPPAAAEGQPAATQ